MKMLPVFIWRQPEAWAAVSVNIERRTHRSSANFAVCGNRLLISSPLRPCFANSKGDCIRWPTARLFEPTLQSPEYAVPLNFVRAGFGSNVSTWLGPPFMKRKTQCLAFAGKWGCLGARGPAFVEALKRGSVEAPAAEARLEKKPLLESRSINASPAKPPPTCQRNSRRVRPQGTGLGMKREVAGVMSDGRPFP